MIFKRKILVVISFLNELELISLYTNIAIFLYIQMVYIIIYYQ